MSQELTTDIVIIGGGIAGLWLLNRLRQQGFDVLLLEKSALGAGQTIASQGIIHGGLKYALNGALSPASSAIAGMPEHWRRCLRGEGDLDLRTCKVLAPHYYMWSSGGYRSRLKSFLGSKALRGRIDALDASDYPDFLRGQEISGTLYQLTDFVVDTPSLLKTLAAGHEQRLFQVNGYALQLCLDAVGSVEQLSLQTPDGPLRLRAGRYILCAGEGNAALLQQAGIDSPAMQTRPLHMLALHTQHPHPVYLHCIGDSFGMTPQLTITSHPQADGSWVWYIGGEIAESGVERSPEQQIAEGKRQLRPLFPWLDIDAARWHSFRINRAEPKLPNLQRPDTAYHHSVDKLILTWPTKLTLSPQLGNSVLATLQEQGFHPATAQAQNPAAVQLRRHFPQPGIALPCWDELTS